MKTWTNDFLTFDGASDRVDDRTRATRYYDYLYFIFIVDFVTMIHTVRGTTQAFSLLRLQSGVQARLGLLQRL